MKYFDAYIKPALEKFYKNDIHLIEKDVHEQTMSARIAHYLIEQIDKKKKVNETIEEEFRDINVDCEYNKNIDLPKYVGAGIYIPDICVHERGKNDNNKFVIEIKKDFGKKSDDDICKILGYINSKSVKYEEGYAIQDIKKDWFYLFFYDRKSNLHECYCLVKNINQHKKISYNITQKMKLC